MWQNRAGGSVASPVIIAEGGWVAFNRVVAAGRWSSAPIRRAVARAKAENRLIDLSYNQPRYWVLFLDTGQVAVVSASIFSAPPEGLNR